MKIALVITTVDSEEAAERIARAALDSGLVACAQIAPIRSLYRWKGKTEDAREYRIEMKARADDYPALEKTLLELHPYGTPEIVRLDVEDGYRPYLDWVARGGG